MSMEKFAIELLQKTYHIHPEEIARYITGFTSDRRFVGGHLAYCADCRKEVNEIRGKQKETKKKILAPSEHYNERKNEIILSMNEIYVSIALEEKKTEEIEKKHTMGRNTPKNKWRRLRPK